MAKNEAAEVEMCNCGCGHTKEETIQALMLMRGGDRADAEQAYVEFGEAVTDEDRQFRDFLADILGDGLDRRRQYEAESLRAREAGEEMCSCGCGRSRKQIIEGFQQDGDLNEEQANALYEKCAASQKETGGVTPAQMQQFLDEVAPGRFEVRSGE